MERHTANSERSQMATYAIIPCIPLILSIKIEGEIKTFHDKDTLKEYITTKWALQRILEGIHQTEVKGKSLPKSPLKSSWEKINRESSKV